MKKRKNRKKLDHHWIWALRRNIRWWRLYRRRVRALEYEIGCEIHPC